MPTGTRLPRRKFIVCSEDRMQSRINSPVNSIALLHFQASRRFRGNTGCDTHHGFTSLIHGLPDTRSNTRKNRRTEGGSFFSANGFDLTRINIRLNLAPQGRPRTASAQTDLLHRHADFLEYRKCVFQTVRYALEYRPNHMRPRVGSRESHKCR